MADKEHILIGVIIKLHGFDGTVIVRAEKNYSGKIKESEPVFLIVDGRAVPFFVDYIEQNKPGTLLLKFEDYDSPDAIKEFIGCEIMLPDDTKLADNGDDSDDLTDYRVISADGSSIGIVTEVISNPGQYLLNVKTESGTEMLIPLHEDLIQEIDRAVRSIRMSIPDGLTDINR